MSKRDWTLFLEDILESIGLIESYVDGMDAESFAEDRKTVDAVVRNFEIIGEAAKSYKYHISNSLSGSSSRNSCQRMPESPTRRTFEGL